MLKAGPGIPEIATKLGVKLVAGPFVSREHLTVLVVESEKAEAVDQFILQSGLEQWNSVRVLPSNTMQDGMRELQQAKPIY
jgi:hypothetical protein